MLVCQVLVYATLVCWLLNNIKNVIKDPWRFNMTLSVVLFISASILLILGWNWLALLFLCGAIYKFYTRNKNVSLKISTEVTDTKNPNDPSVKRTKLKEAVKLKKTDLPIAIQLLREAYEDGEATTHQELLRLPNYLRMNQQYDEAYTECRRLAHEGNPFEPTELGSTYWFFEQNDILKLQSRICMDWGHYIDGLYCNVEHYYNELKVEEIYSKHESTFFRERGAERFEFLRNDRDYIMREVLGKIPKYLKKEDKINEAISIIFNWNKLWPQDPQVLGSKLELLFAN